MRILIASLASNGFLFPMIGLAHELRCRGHEVAFATDISFSKLLDGEGFTRIARGSTKDGTSFAVPGWTDRTSVILQIKHLEHAVETFRPDLLIGQQLTYGPLLVADRMRLPIVLMGQSVYLWRRVSPTKTLDGLDGLEHRQAARWHGWYTFYSRMRTSYRLPALEPEEAERLHGDTFLLRSVPEWQADPSILSPRVRLVGACLWEPEDTDDALVDWLESMRSAGRKIVYVQHGRAFGFPSFWPELKRGFADSEIALAASVGRMDREVGDVPKNFFVREHLPQARILPWADAVISNANSTVTLGALCHGLPSLMIPLGAEQPDIAARGESLGVARVAHFDQIHSDFLRRETDTVLGDTAIRSNARRMGEAFAVQAGFNAAASHIEQLSPAVSARL